MQIESKSWSEGFSVPLEGSVNFNIDYKSTVSRVCCFVPFANLIINRAVSKKVRPGLLAH